MAHSDDDPAGRDLPVTAEVGDEGGSYADATQQVETFSGVFGNRRVDPKQVGSTAGAATPAPDAGDDVTTHATERPERPQ